MPLVCFTGKLGCELSQEAHWAFKQRLRVLRLQPAARLQKLASISSWNAQPWHLEARFECPSPAHHLSLSLINRQTVHPTSNMHTHASREQIQQQPGRCFHADAIRCCIYRVCVDRRVASLSFAMRRFLARNFLLRSQPSKRVSIPGFQVGQQPQQRIACLLT